MPDAKERPASSSSNASSSDAPSAGSTEARLIEAAQEVFAKRGRCGARTREIADRAGTGAPSVNYYFRSKDRLYEAAFEEVFDGFLSGLAVAVGEAGTFREALRALVEHFGQFYIEHPDAIGLWLQENLAGGEMASRMIREGGGETALDAFVELYASAESAGRVRSVDPYHFFISTMGACLMLPIGRPTLRATIPPFDQEPNVFETERVDAVFDLLWHGLSKETSSGSQRGTSAAERGDSGHR